MGLVFAATEGALPGVTWLYFAMCQFPFYLAPYLLKKFVTNEYEVPREIPRNDKLRRRIEKAARLLIAGRGRTAASFDLVPRKGFEPPTHALRMRCSTG